ncbi:Cyclic nucleotide-binding domain [Phytophthora infestans]|uniref:Cyclic nucleotide-binding domain n=1 Tax=Phytophthora infestans TaxID=4787 RepID=A0A833WBE4_PHYIN|nr:Cyclic nucleotide-binding domain [Phytophthora infestans]
MAKMSTVRERAVSSIPAGEVWQQTQWKSPLARMFFFFRRRKRSWFIGMVVLELFYVFVSIPLRIGFLFDPYATDDWSSGWTDELTVFTVLDVLADTAGFASLLDIFAAQRRAQAAVAADAIGSIGARRQRSTKGPNNPPGRRASLLSGIRDSMQVAWSLNTIIPKSHRHHGIQRPVLLEIISMIPLELLALAFGPNALHLLRVLKLLRLYRVPGCMRELKHMYTGSRVVRILEYTGNVVLFNTVVMGLVACHWIACGYMAVAHLECGIDFMLCSKALTVLTTIPGAGEHGVPKGIAGVSPTGDGSGYTCWAIDDYLVGTNVGRQYGRAVYWASRSMVTAGFYDVAASTNIETVYVIFAQVLGAIFTTAVLATFLFIFRYRNARMQKFMAHVDSAKEYMQVRHFPENVREGVLGYYKNAWATHQALQHDEVIERLPGHLKVSVYSVLKTKRIQDVAFLAKESIEFINTLALRIEYCVYSPKDWIIEKLPDGMYFVLRGSVQLDGSRHPQTTYAKAGDHFAEGSLLFPTRSDERARAQTYCDLYKLPQRSFNKTLTVFHRENAPQHLEEMRSMHARHDQQEQKMKKMLGRSADNADAMANINNSGGRYSVTYGSDVRVRRQRIPWRIPGSNFRKYWEHARLLSLIFVVFEVPLYCVFDADTFPFGAKSIYSFQSMTSILVEAFFVVDFAFRARFFAYVDQLALITVSDPIYILDAYRENGMWLDLLAIIPLPLVVEFVVNRGHGWTMWLHISRLIRLLRARYLQQTIQEFSHIRGLSSKMQQAGTMLLYVTLLLHVTGCLWFLMARFSVLEAEFEPILEEYTRDRCLRDAGLHGNCSWTLYDAYGQIGTTFKIQDPEHSIYTVQMAYMRSIYWAIAALTTVGYGDIVAFSTYESYFAAVWVFFGGIINYGVVGAMSNIISNLTASSRHHSEKMNAVNVTLGHFRISESVRVRIRQFYHQQMYEQKVTSEVELLDGLPTQLRHRISSILHAESVRKVPLFVDAQNERLLYELTGLFRRQLFQRGDPFFAEGTLCEEMYVVVNGRANIFSKRVGALPIGALSAGDCFGVCELLLRKSFNTTVIAASVVDASVITYSAFVAKIERHFPIEMENLRSQATQQHIFDTLTLEAVVDNIKSRSTLMKFTEKCTSMFEEKENWGKQRNKLRLRLYWDLIVLALDVYNAFQVTFRIGFLAHPSSGTRLFLMASDFVGDVLLAADIYLKLYYFECEEVGMMNLVYREERSETYTGRELRNDLLSSLPLYYVGSSFLAMSLCRLPRLLRLHQIPGMIDSLIMRLQQKFSAGGNISAYLSPIKLVLILLFTGHLAACVFYLICHTDHNHKNWTHHDPIVVMEHESTGVLYLRAFYWALTTLTLVGSREIVPLGLPGTLWATFTCLCCAFVVGHIVGELSELFLEMDATRKELKERESHFDQFAKDHDLPSSICTRVQHYLKFQHHYLKGLDIYDTFSDLSPNLRVQLMLDLHGNTLQNLCIAPFLNQTQINGLAVRLKSELYIPGDTIIVEGDLGHKLYIVKGGTGMVLWKSTGTAVATLTAGSLFGEVAFFLRGQRRIASVQATTCSELLVLGRRSWEELLASSPREEAESTERALIQWVQFCLKGYNIMTVELVKDIKSGDSGTSKKPKNIEELRELNAIKTPDDEDNTPVTGPLRYMSATALEERKVRQLLRKTAGYGGSRAKLGAAATPNMLTIFCNWIRDHVLPSGRKAAKLGRVYADYSPENSRTEPVLTPPSGRRLFAWHTPRNTSSLTKMKSFKNGAAMQINPVSRSMREYYRDDQLDEMEEECWRRYKVSLFMADAFTGEVSKPSPVVIPVSPQLSIQSPPSTITSQNTSKNEEDSASTASKKIRVSRKTFCGAMLPGASPQRATRTLVTTDGMRFLENYESRNRPSERGLSRKRRPRGSIHGHELHQSFGLANLPSGAARAHRRQRKLKRSQSLPLFDRHFAHMIRDELQDSNAKEFESKLNLGFELLQRCRQPEFSSLFRVYLSWLKHKGIWSQWYSRQMERFTWLNSFSSSHSDSENAEKPRTDSFFHDVGHSRTASLKSLRDTGSTSSKAEAFVNLLSRCFRLWEWLVVLVGLFYAVTIPFFVCFAADLETFHEDHEDEIADRNHNTFPMLAHWERIVVLVDLVCIADFFLKHSAFRKVLVLRDGGSTDVPTATPQPVAPPPLKSMSSLRTFVPTAPPQVTHKRKSWWHQHVNTHLWIDLVTSLPFDILLYIPPLSTSSMNDHRWFYLSLFQLNKIPRILESIEASERLTQFLAADLNLPIGESRLHFIRTVCIYLLSGHWIGCLWFRLGLHAYNIYGGSWLSTYKMLAVDEFEELSEIPTCRRYLRSLHFAIGSITTVFYGDVVSMNAIETVVEIAFIVVCILIFGVLVGAQGEMIEANYKHKMLFEQNLMELYHFLKNNDVPRDVRQRLRLYYTNTWLKYHGHDDLEGVRGLSTLLVEDIAQYTLRSFANRVSILKSCDESFLRSLLTCLKHIICSSSEAVVRKGDVDRSMYFIAKGKILVQGPGFELVKHEGDFFGELSLLYGIPRSATCSSLGVSLLYVLEWETYERLLADYPEYREQNRREWVIVSTVLKTGESRFRSIINIVARMEKANWVLVDQIIRKAKSLK